MRKRIISLVLMAAMTTTLFAGCTSETRDKDSANPKTVDISLGIWPGDDLPEDIPVFEGYAATLKEKNPNVSIKPDHYSY